jgi:hypothetical protein
MYCNGSLTPSEQSNLFDRVLLPWGARSLAKGDWMKIGDEYGEDIGRFSMSMNDIVLPIRLTTLTFSLCSGADTDSAKQHRPDVCSSADVAICVHVWVSGIMGCTDREFVLW